MRSNRRKNWFIKRIALGLAIAAVAAPVAQAKVDESSIVQAHTYQPVQAQGYQAFATDFPSSQVNASNEVVKPIPYRWPSSGDALKGIAYRQFVTDFPSSQVNASDYGMPRAMPSDYALASRDVVRADPPGQTVSDIGNVVRADPPGQTVSDIGNIGEPQVVAAGFDWNDAAIGAGLALLLVALGGGTALATRHLGRPQTA